MINNDLSKAAADGKLPDLTSRQTQIFERLSQTKSMRKLPVILIVEDQHFSSQLLMTMLLGHSEVYVAQSAEVGWQTFIDIYPDIAFVDIGLARVNGHELAKKIKRLAPETYVAMVTAHNSFDDVAIAKKNGVDAFIAKPYNKTKVMECLAKYNEIKKFFGHKTAKKT